MEKASKPTRLPVRAETIPEELKALPQNCLWRWELRDGKWTKPPYQPNCLPARSNDPNSWCSTEDVLKAYHGGQWDGIGFFLTPPYVGIDLDDCRNPESGELRDWAKALLNTFRSYSEISPSGKGIKILCRGTLPGGGHHSNRLGVFQSNRYFCITGHVVNGYSKIRDCQKELDDLIHREWPEDLKRKEETKATEKQHTAPRASDFEIFEKAMKAEDGGKFRRLWEGEISDYPSASEADLALCTKLAFWFGKDPAKVDAIFRQSGLMRDKWERADYSTRTIEKALTVVDEQYTPQSPPESPQVKKLQKQAPRISPDHIYNAERMVDEYRSYVKSLEKARFITGIREVDHIIRGVAGGEVLTIIARAGCFKTTILQHLLKRYAENSKWAAVFFSLEMPVASLTERYHQMIQGEGGKTIEKRFLEGEQAALQMEKELVSGLQRFFVIPVKVSPEDVKAYVRLVEKTHGIRAGVIGIDYLGLLDEPGRSEYEVVSKLARDIKGLAKELSLPVVLLAQTSRRAGSGEVEISMDMARGSGAIEESADFCLGLFQAEGYRLSTEAYGEKEIILKVLKNRKGPAGRCFKLDLDPSTLRLGTTSGFWEPPKKSKRGADL